MAIFKLVSKKDGRKTRKIPVRTPDLSYAPNDSLAQMIVDAWVDADYRQLLLTRGHARPLFAARGFYLQNPIVITEAEYYDDYTQQDPDEVVFVLPLGPGNCPPGANLLETARLMLATTPNGI